MSAQGTAPDAPRGLTASAPAHDREVLSWDDPNDTSITGYRVARRDVDNDPAATFTVVADNTGSAAHYLYRHDGYAGDYNYLTTRDLRLRESFEDRNTFFQFDWDLTCTITAEFNTRERTVTNIELQEAELQQDGITIGGYTK